MRYKISANVIRRLPRYLRWMRFLERQQVEKISSGELAARLGVTASQIRQDFNCFGGFGQQGYGYNIHELREEMAEILGVHETLTAVVIGTGNLGRALISNFRFSEYGFRVIAAFDNQPSLIGTVINGVTVRDAGEIGDFLKNNPVDVAILTLPQSSANAAAKLAADHGVRGIWNFTGIDFDSDLGDTVVEDVHLSDSLLTLGYHLRGSQNTKEDL